MASALAKRGFPPIVPGMDLPNFWVALGLTLFAGLSTGLGSLIAFGAQRTSYRFLSVSAGFSAGVMLYVSFVEILPKAERSLVRAEGAAAGPWLAVGAFFLGIILIALIDAALPHAENPHEQPSEADTAPLHAGAPPVPPTRLRRMAMLTALAIAIHNFPEGLATFLAALEDPGVGLAIAVAIALHNIPEGISVSVPLFYATGSRAKALALSFLSGLAEPVGALIGFGLLQLISPGAGVSPELLGYCFAAVAGVMVYISIDQLLPTSRAYGKGHDSILGLLAGMAVMAASLLLLRAP